MTKSRWFSWLAPLLLSLGIVVPTFSASTASAQPAIVIETAPPARIETYPSVVYAGRPVYLVNNHWYYRSGPRWVYYREAPAPLWRIYREHEAIRAERAHDRAVAYHVERAHERAIAYHAERAHERHEVARAYRDGYVAGRAR